MVHDYSTVGFLPVGTEVKATTNSRGLPSENAIKKVSRDCSVVDTCDYAVSAPMSKSRVRKGFLHKQMGEKQGTLHKQCLSNFLEVSRDGSEWTCILYNVAHWRDIPKDKVISVIWHDILEERPCIRCMGTIDDLYNGFLCSRRDMKDIGEARVEYVQSLRDRGPARA